MAKKENDKYTYAMRNEVLPLAHSLSRVHTKVALNIPREFRIQKSKTKGRYHLVGLSIIATDLNPYSTMACTWKPKLGHHSQRV